MASPPPSLARAAWLAAAQRSVPSAHVQQQRAAGQRQRGGDGAEGVQQRPHAGSASAGVQAVGAGSTQAGDKTGGRATAQRALDAQQADGADRCGNGQPDGGRFQKQAHGVLLCCCIVWRGALPLPMP
ncbi:hypothetical protein QF022_001823 [Vogesella perlucida]|nr:hypothetical protein [Vogesella perlucida]